MEETAGSRVGETRSVGLTILWSILTLGIYTLFWCYWTFEELPTIPGPWPWRRAGPGCLHRLCGRWLDSDRDHRRAVLGRDQGVVRGGRPRVTPYAALGLVAACAHCWQLCLVHPHSAGTQRLLAVEVSRARRRGGSSITLERSGAARSPWRAGLDVSSPSEEADDGFVRSDGCDLDYEEVGEGVPILLIHPAGATASTWGAATEELTRIGRVITYDRRGNARSGGEPVR